MKYLKKLGLYLPLPLLALGLWRPAVIVHAVGGDFSISGLFDNSAMAYGVKSVVNGADPDSDYHRMQAGNNSNEALSGSIVVDSNSTQWGSDGVFGSVRNASTTTNAAGGSFYGLANGDGIGTGLLDRVRVWGVNPLVADLGHNHVYMTNELDYNVTGPDTLIVGMSSNGASSHAPAPGSTWLLAGQIGPGISWPVAYGCYEGAAAVCLQLGARNAGNNTTSQILRWFSRDSGGTLHYTDMTLDANGNLAVSFAGGNPVWINKDGSITAKAFHTY